MSRLVVGLLGVMLVAGCGPATESRALRREPGPTRLLLTYDAPPGPAVELTDEEFVAAVEWLAEDVRVREVPEPGSIVLASYEPPRAGGLELLHGRELKRDYDAWCASMHRRPDCEGVLQGADTFTVETKPSLAMAIALMSAWDGAAAEFREMVSPGKLVALVGTALAGAAAMAISPELASKGLLALFTGAAWIYLGSELLHLAQGYVEMSDAVDAATTFDEVRVAGERFGRRIGQKTARLLVMVAMAVLAPKVDVEGTLPELPGFAGAAARVRGVEGGLTVASVVGEARLVTVAANGLAVTLPAGVAAMAAGGTPAAVAVPAPKPTAPKMPAAKGAPPANAPKVVQSGTGPHSPGYKSYRSFKSFKRALGSAGNGKEWHHVVEQTPGNVVKFGAKEIHNTDNVIALDKALHAEVSRLYSQVRPDITHTMQTVRAWLSKQSYMQQRDFGLLAIENIRKAVW